MRTGTHKIVGSVLALLCCIALAVPAGAQAAQSAPPQNAAEANSSSKPHDGAYVIGASDMLSINVWKEPDVSRMIPVRSDGKISLPLVGEVQASGKTPLQLEQEITNKLKTYISDPEVTVMVQDSKSQKFNVLGMVAKPGAYPLLSTTTVLDAIALAGGFRDFAKKKSMYVLRKDALGQPQRIPFNYKDVISGKNPEQNVQLQDNDTVVVP
ncbi:MAG TPA: polysaccharide biosynthesis/export family protein [Terriglobales bacterium]|nr:polysaccharide biosynthesis/export family protein [Terriglobales bacterium]